MMLQLKRFMRQDLGVFLKAVEHIMQIFIMENEIWLWDESNNTSIIE